MADVDAKLERLSASKAAWAAASLDERIQLLKDVRARLLDQLVPWSRATTGVRCTTRPHQQAGDMIVTATVISQQIDGYVRSLQALKASGALPRAPAARTAAQGQPVLDVFPLTWRDRWLTLPGATGARVQLYLQPGQPETQGHFYREPHAGRVAVVLGAGNQHFLALADALHMAVVEGCCVLLKYHPQMAPVAPFIDYVMEPLARLGFFASTADPDLEVTRHALYHPLTDCVHMTGGTATHDAIVWGADPAEQERRRAANDPLLKVPITSELGCVTPWLVVPGRWSEAEITHHARALAEALSSNCSCNCLAPKVVLLAEGWDQGGAFVAAVKEELAGMAAPAPYYAGLRQRYEAWRQRYPQAQAIEAKAADPGAACGPPLPYLVNELAGYPADPKSEYAFQVEPFAPVLTFVRVPTAGASGANGANGGQPGGASLAEAFLQEAVRAANEDLWGSLSCTVLVHPDTEAACPAAVQAALDGLRFGTVSVNSWSAAAFTVQQGRWGGWGHPGQTTADVQSGIGAIHNTFMYDHTEKAVFRTPFISAAHPQPERYGPLSLALGKLIAGLTHSGPWGAAKLLLARD